jgi:hypothetical protein
LLSEEISSLYPRFSITGNGNFGLPKSPDNGLQLNQWYHIAYTISDPEKRMDVYVDGKWTAYLGIRQVQTQNVIFNDGPLHIGNNPHWGGITWQIRYIWSLSS